MSDFAQHTDTNRRMWNQAADFYQRQGFAEALEHVQRPDFSTFDPVEQTYFAAIGLAGKAVIQLGANNGTELLSVKKHGAGRCVGIDIAQGFVEQAQALARAADLEVEFICSDLYSLDHRYDGAFDVVYVTVGVLGWLSDLAGFFGLARRLLRPGGQLFIYEQHPLLGVFNPKPPHARDASYFQTTPFLDDMLPEYIDPQGQQAAPSYWFPHTLAAIFTACLGQSFRLTRFEEHAHDLSDTYRALEATPALPLSFSLLVQKPN